MLKNEKSLIFEKYSSKRCSKFRSRFSTFSKAQTFSFNIPGLLKMEVVEDLGLEENEVERVKGEVNNNTDQPEVQPEVQPEAQPEVEDEEELVSVYELNSGFRVKVSSGEEWLCIARLPREFAEPDVRKLAEEYGNVEEIVMINSEKTGRP